MSVSKEYSYNFKYKLRLNIEHKKRTKKKRKNTFSYGLPYILYHKICRMRKRICLSNAKALKL